jgi:predicted PurR-regulated permease PerM
MARDDFDDRPVAPGGRPTGGMDGFFANTPLAIILAVVLFFCCWPIGLVLGIVGVATCKHPDAKRNAMIMLALSAVAVVITIIYWVVMGAAAFQLQPVPAPGP